MYIKNSEQIVFCDTMKEHSLCEHCKATQIELYRWPCTGFLPPAFAGVATTGLMCYSENIGTLVRCLS